MRGGMTSHPDVVARGMGKSSITGCAAALIDEEKQTLTINGKVYSQVQVDNVKNIMAEYRA